MSRILATFAGLLICCGMQAQCHGEKVTLRVMTFNLYHGGVRLGQPLSQSVKAIKAARADIVGIQESHAGSVDNAEQIAERLGWHHFAQGGRTAVISRFPIVGNTPGKWGVHLKLSSGLIVHVFNAHLHYIPYQPYQLAEIPYGDFPFIKTEQEAIAWAVRARGAQKDRLLAELRPSLEARIPCFLTGDFNEPSFQDWTKSVAATGRIPLKVEYPATKAIVDAGMLDGYRVGYPDPVKSPGWTWTPTTQPTDPRDRHDRIDFVFSSLKPKSVKSAAVVGETAKSAEIVLKPWPSDHRAVVVEYEFNAPSSVDP